jgi:hypothetical protein
MTDTESGYSQTCAAGLPGLDLAKAEPLAPGSSRPRGGLAPWQSKRIGSYIEHKLNSNIRGTDERLLVAESEPPIGAHIVTRRHGYTHHGIYVGVGKVVHYAGLSRGLRRGPVEEISFSRFAAGHPASIVSGIPSKFQGREVARRARSRIGEDNYRILTNNCEHFCEWCVRGQHRSYQIDAWLALPSRALHMPRRLITELLSLVGLEVQTMSKVPFSKSGYSAQWIENSVWHRPTNCKT